MSQDLTKKQEVEKKNPMSLSCFDVDQLRNYVRGTGKIVPRKRTRLSAREQRHVARMIKQARCLLLMR